MLDIAIFILIGLNAGYVLRLAHEAYTDRREDC